MKKLLNLFVIAFVLLGAQLVFAQEAPKPISPDDDLGGLMQIVWNAVTTKNWKLVFALGVVLVTWALRKYGGKTKALAWTQTDRGGAVLGMLTGGASTIAVGLMAGKPLDLTMLGTAFGGGVGVLGLFTFWKKGVLGGTKKDTEPLPIDLPPPQE